VDFSNVPAGLSAINAVPFDGEHAVSGLPKLVTALKSDLAGSDAELSRVAQTPSGRILDESISGARLLSDGTFLVWSINRTDLQIVSENGQRGPVLRGHRADIKDANQLADGRILSRAEDSTIRVWLGSVDQAVAWADDVIAWLRPLTLAERCRHYLESSAACGEIEME